MDFLDPQKQRTQRYIFGIGYTLIAVAILIGTIILLYLSNGFGFGKNGQIIQNGLIFVSTKPSGANIYVNGKLNKNKTSTRLQLPAGEYALKLTRDGYRDWQRNISVQGATVQHFDYPLLFPKQLATTTVKSFAAAPPLTLQSPDRRWLLVMDSVANASYLQYDLNNPKQASTAGSIPSTVVATPDNVTDEAFSLVEWSTDNKHVLLSHTYTGGQEYILFDRDSPADSVNLTKTLKLTAGQQISLRDKAYDHYFVLDPSTQTLSTADIANTTPVLYLDKVLAYKSYGSDTVLYASSANVSADKAQILLRQNGTDYPIRQVDASPPYLLDLTKYDNTLYAALGASGDNEVYIYQDPVGQQQRSLTHTMVPVSVLRVTTPNYLAFSSSAQFITIENGTQFAVYNAESDEKFTYTTTTPLDPGQAHAIWTDGNRLAMTSNGMLTVFDYDHTNQQSLVPADGRYLPFFDRNYKFVYALTAKGTKLAGNENLTSTSLLLPKDQ
jgi:hypothetical protein